MCVCARAKMCVLISLGVWVRKSVCARMYIYICVCVCVIACMRVCKCACVCVYL